MCEHIPEHHDEHVVSHQILLKICSRTSVHEDANNVQGSPSLLLQLLLFSGYGLTLYLRPQAHEVNGHVSVPCLQSILGVGGHIKVCHVCRACYVDVYT